MGLDIWFREDIERALEAAELASSATVAVLETAVADPDALRMFRRGYKAALTVVAFSFGLGDDGDHGRLQQERLHRGSDPVPFRLSG